MQRGDSFDLALVMTSLLLGAGYDAYVAVSTAPARLATNDVSHTRCPALPQGDAPGDAEGGAPVQTPGAKTHCVHAWVIVLPGHPEVSARALRQHCSAFTVCATSVLLSLCDPGVLSPGGNMLHAHLSTCCMVHVQWQLA
jgi:hypothetical protein